VKFREIHDAKAIFLSGIPMQTEANRGLFLESNGMVEIRVFQGETEMSLQAGKQVEVDLATKSRPSTDFKLWVYETIHGLLVGVYVKLIESYKQTQNNKAEIKALTQKLRDNEIILVDSLSIAKTKTKDAVSSIKGLAKNFKDLATKKKNAAVIGFDKRDKNTELSFRNIKGFRLDLIKNINIVDLLNHKYLIIENPKETLKVLEARVK
jgi:hypothetical protein